MYSIGPASISDLPAIKFDGIYRVLGCIPETIDSIKGFQHFAMAAPVEPSQFREIDMSSYGNPIWNQAVTSSCTGQGSTAGVQLSYMISGRPLIEFNPYFVYGLINNGRDAGAMISDALRALMQYGTCPKADLAPGMMFKNQFPQQAFDDAKRFRLEQAFHCSTFEEVCMAITLGFPCVLGIYVDDNFINVGSDGVAPVPTSNRGGGHCILGVGLKYSTRYGWLIKIQNSWGVRFGMNGHAYIHKGHFQFMNPDAFAIQSVIDDPNATNNIPVVTN